MPPASTSCGCSRSNTSQQTSSRRMSRAAARSASTAAVRSAADFAISRTRSHSASSSGSGSASRIRVRRYCSTIRGPAADRPARTSSTSRPRSAKDRDHAARYASTVSSVMLRSAMASLPEGRLYRLAEPIEGQRVLRVDAGDEAVPVAGDVVVTALVVPVTPEREQRLHGFGGDCVLVTWSEPTDSFKRPAPWVVQVRVLPDVYSCRCSDGPGESVRPLLGVVAFSEDLDHLAFGESRPLRLGVRQGPLGHCNGLRP